MAFGERTREHEHDNIVNDLAGLFAHSSQPELDTKGACSASGLVLVLDDYHTITDPAIDEILTSLIKHLPQGIHLALVTRIDPRLPLSGWRARRDMTETRSVDLRFTSGEAQAFLEGTTGAEFKPETIRLLEGRTEGWRGSVCGDRRFGHDLSGAVVGRFSPGLGKGL